MGRYAEIGIGRRVWWSDPDNHFSSGIYTVTWIGTESHGDVEDDTVISIKNDAGSHAEVPRSEIIPADCSVEFCPECEHEVELVNRMEVQTCPACEKPILPCAYCCELHYEKYGTPEAPHPYPPCGDCALGK